MFLNVPIESVGKYKPQTAAATVRSFVQNWSGEVAGKICSAQNLKGQMMREIEQSVRSKSLITRPMMALRNAE